MAKNFTIEGSALVITDTESGAILFEAPKRDAFFNTKELINGVIQIYDTSGLSELQAQQFSCNVSDAIINGLSADIDDFRNLQRSNLGFNSAPGGSGAVDTNQLKFVSTKYDFGEAVGGVVTLDDYTTFFVTTDIDLEGWRIECGINNVIIGASSENCSITSTGLSSDYVIRSNYTLPIRHITLKNNVQFVGINPDNLAAGNIALDWTGVNFSGCTKNVFLGDIDNFIFDKGAILDGGSIVVNGDIGTFAINNSLLIASGDAEALVELTASANVTRRFRMIYSSITVFGSSVGIDVDPYAFLPVDRYILDTCNFAGGGSYLMGLNHLDNESNFKNCTGIVNTAEIANMYMVNNAVATVISSPGTPTKISGSTVANEINQKFIHTDNNLQYSGILQKSFQITAIATFTSGNNNVIGLYIAKNGVVIDDSEMYATTSASGRAESITVHTITEMSNADNIEVWIENETAANNITVEYLNVICKSLN